MAVDVEQVILDLSISGDMADTLRAQAAAADAHGLAIDGVNTSLKRAKDGTYALVAALKTYDPSQRAAKKAARDAAREAEKLAREQKRAAQATREAATSNRLASRNFAQLGTAIGRVYIRTRTLILSFIGLKSMAVLIRNVLRTLGAGMNEYLSRNDEAQRSVYGLRDSLKDLNGAVGEAIFGGGNAGVMFGALNRAIQGVEQIVKDANGQFQTMSRTLAADIATVAVFVAQIMLRFAQAVNVVRNAFALLEFAVDTAWNVVGIAVASMKIAWFEFSEVVADGLAIMMRGIRAMAVALHRDTSAIDRQLAIITERTTGYADASDRAREDIRNFTRAISGGAEELRNYTVENLNSTIAMEAQIRAYGDLGRELRSGILTGAAAAWQRFGGAIAEAASGTRDLVTWLERLLALMAPYADYAEAFQTKLRGQKEGVTRLFQEAADAAMEAKIQNAAFMNAERDHVIALIKYEQDLLALKRDGWAAALSEAKSFTKESAAIQAGLLLIEGYITARRAAMNLATPGMQGFGVAQGIAAADAIREAIRLGAKGAGGGGGTRSGPSMQAPQNIANIYVTQNNSGIGVNGGDMARSLAPIMQSAFDNHHVVVRS